MTHAAPPRAGHTGGPVRLSMFSVQDHYPDRGRPLPQFYAETVEQCVLAARAPRPRCRKSWPAA